MSDDEHMDIKEIKIENDEDIKPSKSGEVLFPNETKFTHIKNKQVRIQQFQKTQRELKKVSTPSIYFVRPFKVVDVVYRRKRRRRRSANGKAPPKSSRIQLKV